MLPHSFDAEEFSCSTGSHQQGSAEPRSPHRLGLPVGELVPRPLRDGSDAAGLSVFVSEWFLCEASPSGPLSVES